MKNWKFLLTIILISFLTYSCKRTASDINTKKIKTPCEWLEAYEIVVLEYYEFVDKNAKKYNEGVQNSEPSREKIEKKRKFYDNLLTEIKSLPGMLKSIDMPGPCNGERKKFLDNKYKLIYDSLLLRISPNYVAESYLTALMDKDYNRLKVFSDSADYDNIDMMKELEMDLGIYEVKDISCDIKDNGAKCTFCCTKDTSWKYIKLQFDNGHWFIQPAKEDGPMNEEEIQTN
jgi:hypothetical protein